jgi:CBS domain-containing protein
VKPFTFDEFARVISAGEVATLERFPGLVRAKDAIKDTDDRLTALKQMESLNADFVAVVDVNGKFAGVVSRARITSSMLVDIAERLQR